MTTRADLTLVLDIGKSHAKLLMIDAAGALVEQHGRANRSVTSALGYPALDLAGLAQWVAATLAALPATGRCTRAIASTHGAAFVALGERGPAWDPIDYEFEGVDRLHGRYQSERDPFDATLAPDLPAGLNAARQMHWLQHTHPQAWERTRCLLPYPQYWAWWLSGEVASEVSSLGCHTQLWNPTERCFTRMAVRQGWAERFAPLRPAWERLGAVSPQRARETGLPRDCAVYVGVHDSNACLARYLGAAAGIEGPMTLVSTGTWIVVMAPGASASGLDPARDMLANVAVNGTLVPTARFMGGRELEALCAGAKPHEARLDVVAQLVQRDVQALPSFNAAGGPFAGLAGRVLEGSRTIDATAALSAAERASLAALYCAQVSAYLIGKLAAPLPAVIEGPFADNPVFCHALAALLPPSCVRVSADRVDGTARGAWRLAHWAEALEAQVLASGGDASPKPGNSDDGPLTLANGADAPLRVPLQRYHERWLGRLPGLD